MSIGEEKMHNPQTKKLPPPRPEDLPRFFARLSRDQLEAQLLERDRAARSAREADFFSAEFGGDAVAGLFPPRR